MLNRAADVRRILRKIILLIKMTPASANPVSIAIITGITSEGVACSRVVKYIVFILVLFVNDYFTLLHYRLCLTGEENPYCRAFIDF